MLRFAFMIIERIETAQVPPRWGLLRVTTSSGLEGYGEFTVEGQLDASEAAVKEMAEGFVGQDATDIKRLVRGRYDQCFYHGGAHFMSALGGVEMALWDILGKSLGQPVYSLLGGRVRDKVKVYRWAGGNNNSARAAAEEAAPGQTGGGIATPGVEELATPNDTGKGTTQKPAAGAREPARLDSAETVVPARANRSSG